MREFNRIETEPKLTEIELNLGVLRAATQTITGRNKNVKNFQSLGLETEHVAGRNMGHHGPQ